MLIVSRQHRQSSSRFADPRGRDGVRPYFIDTTPSHKLSGRSPIAHGWHVNCRVVRRGISLHYTNLAA